ncbi:MAG: deoxyribonuclease V [Deltaproteobacteria bacterium]|nr:deoxyribonuclease V [Deltaproteobacteria bacterium]
MKIVMLHRWDVTCAEAILIQQKLRDKLVLGDEPGGAPPKTVAGADISYSRHSDLFFAVVLLFSYPALEVLEEACWMERVRFPYVPGLLSFREGPPLLRAFEGLSRTPDLAIFDGQGIAHPRGVGLASHMGLFIDVPTIGCAKTRLVGEYEPPGMDRGDLSELLYKGEPVGKVLRTKKNVRPLFVSPGHRIGRESAAEFVLSCCRGYRSPEPLRRAHLRVNELRIEHA